MTPYLFPPDPVPSLPIIGQTGRYAVRRIFCVGRNYVAHAAEMGGEVDREAPWYFTKSPFNLTEGVNGCPYPAGTSDYHHEVECVVALGPGGAPACYGVGLDMTRRDRQAEAKATRRPWDVGKDVEGGAVFGPLTLAADVPALGPQQITLTVNGNLRQQALLSDMVWPVSGILTHLATFYQLGAGDVIMTGTPAGVAPVVPGDTLVAHIDGLAPLHTEILPA